MEIRIGSEIYEISMNATAITARRSKTVHDLTIKSEELALDAWLAALSGALSTQAAKRPMMWRKKTLVAVDLPDCSSVVGHSG